MGAAAGNFADAHPIKTLQLLRDLEFVLLTFISCAIGHKGAEVIKSFFVLFRDRLV
jgi:hypothetical protein